MAKKKAASGGGDEFEKFANDPKLKKAWQEARKADPDSFGSNAVLPDGNYVCRVPSARVGVTKKEPRFPYLSIDTVVLKGEHQGAKVNHFFNLSPEKMEYAVKALKRLGYEFDDAELSDMKGIAADLATEKPIIEIAAQNKTVEAVDPNNKKRKIQKEVCNYFINKKLDSAD